MSEIVKRLFLCYLFDFKREVALEIVVRIFCGVGNKELVVLLCI